jgi:Type IX secretion system protein PorV
MINKLCNYLRNTMIGNLSVKKIVAILFVFSHVAVFAQAGGFTGTSSANFLKLGVGARAMAMGDAATAIVEDPTALYWNVGAITRIEDDISISFSTMNWLVDTRNSYLAAVLKFDNFGSIGVDLQFLDYGKIEETTVYDQNGTGRYLSANDLSFGIGYAKELTDRFSFGIKVKYIMETIANVSADAFGIDVGAVFHTSFLNNNLRIAAALSNFGSKMKFSGRELSVTYSVPDNPSGKQIPAELTTQEWEVPLLFRFGISNYFVNNEDWLVLASFDVLDSRDFEVRYGVGAEFGYAQTLFLRGGYKFNYNEVTYTAGLGIDFSKILGSKLVLDYFYLDYGALGQFNEITLRIDL